MESYDAIDYDSGYLPKFSLPDGSLSAMESLSYFLPQQSCQNSPFSMHQSTVAESHHWSNVATAQYDLPSQYYYPTNFVQLAESMSGLQDYQWNLFYPTNDQSSYVSTPISVSLDDHLALTPAKHGHNKIVKERVSKGILERRLFGNQVVTESVELVLPKEEPSDDGVTIMMRNIPNRYTREMMLQDFTQKGLMMDVDFLYIPIDLRHQRCVGYCFVNVRNEEAANRFRKAFDGEKLTQIRSEKVCSICLGKVQGLKANIEAYRNSAVLTMPEKYHPLLFDENGVRVSFPAPTLTKVEQRKLKRPKKGVSARPVNFIPHKGPSPETDAKTDTKRMESPPVQ